MGFLIDSSVLIAAERGSISLEAMLTGDLEQQPLAIAAITASELLHGVYRAADQGRAQKRQQFVDHILSLLLVTPFDLDAARVHARLWADLASQGTLIGAHDLLIAATAVSIGYGVITMNAREFSRIAGLPLIRPLDSDRP